MKTLTRKKVTQLFLENATPELLGKMMLTNYTVTFHYEASLQCEMEIDIDHRYLTAEIAFGKRIVNFFFDSPEKVMATLIHELTHILTSRLTDGRKGLSKKKYLELEEQTNEHISKVFYNLWRNK